MRKAFTMIELIFVIVIIGILSAMVLPRYERDQLQEATEQVLRHIRYTQHLAMTDDVYDAKQQTWYLRRWQIEFTTCGTDNIYHVYSDVDANSSDASDAATDPYSGLLIYVTAGCNAINNVTDPKIRLSDWYDVTGMVFSGGCNGSNSIAFDNLGRPYTDQILAASSTDRLLTTDCNITLQVQNGSSAVITVEKETGYSRVAQWN